MKKTTHGAILAICMLFIMQPFKILSNDSIDSINMSNNAPFKFETATLSKNQEEKEIAQQLDQKYIESIANTISMLSELQKNFIKHTEKKEQIKNPQQGYAYVRKVIIPADAKVYIHGDMHGNYNSLRTLIARAIANNEMTSDLIITGKTFFIGLGDYIDRGKNG